MPQHIIVCTGDRHLLTWLSMFSVRNCESMEKIGVLVIGKRDGRAIIMSADDDPVLDLAPSAYARLLRFWAAPYSAQTWILPLYHCSVDAKRFLKTLALCRSCFPRAKITWAHGLTPPVPALAMADSLWCTMDAVHPLPGWLDRYCRFGIPYTLPQSIPSFGTLCPDSIVMAQGPDARPVVSQMLNLAGVAMEEGGEGELAVSAPPWGAPLARDARAYFLALKNCFSRFGYPVSFWVEEGAVYRAGEDFSCLFSPEECARITQATKPIYETGARYHNLPLLPDYVPDPAWRPFAGLRRELVCRLMESMALHSPAFTASTRDFLARLNPRLLTAYECDIFADFLPRQGISVPAAAPGGVSRSPGGDTGSDTGGCAGGRTNRLEEGETFRPKVSVLTPTYNHAAYIKDCIEGVLAQQTSFPIEHVIADDCSTDGTWEIVQEYASRYSHIVPVGHAYHLGGYVNHRDLYQMVRAPYVALCDGDDYFTDPLKLQTQADLLDADYNLGLCFHLTRVSYQGEVKADWIYPPQGMLPGGPRSRYSLEDLLRGNLMQTSSVMYRWRFGPVLPDWFILGTLPSDWYLHLVHAEQGAIGFINKVMSVYRRHKNALYQISERSHLEHRQKYGLEELYTYYVINEHFTGKYMAILRDLAAGVFADLIIYAENNNDNTVLDYATRAYPEIADYTLERIGIL